MSSNSIARRYAGALLKIGLKKNTFERYGQELAAISLALSPSLGELAGPLLKKEVKKEIIEEIGAVANLSPDLVNFMKLLVDKGRLAALPDIATAYREEADEAAGKVTAHVFSAQPLDEATLGQLRVKLTKRLGKSVALETKTDPALIGGIKTRVGSLVIDGTLAGQLERFEGTLRKG